jgi:23S rRNA (pseudouridine1915-N3)-methyltransferase
MKVEVWAIGKTSDAWIESGIAVFEKRLPHYLPFAWVVLPAAKIKTQDADLLRREEARLVMSRLHQDDYLVLLDERGRAYTSVELARWMETRLGDSRRRMVFLIGGAFGFTQEVYDRANAQLSLSKLTFSHQMVRVFLLEQLYRAMTILRGEPYHNE